MKENMQIRKEKRINSVLLWIQTLLFVGIIILLASSLFLPLLLFPLQVLIVLLLFTMGYNNYKLYKRKCFTPVYVGIGILYLITLLFGW